VASSAAATHRLRSALEEYIAANRGDNPRSKARGVNADLVKQAESLLGGFGGESKTAQRETPGQRAAAGTPGRALDSAKERAREMLLPSGANGAAAGDGEQ
jgi:hypothetical protein